MRPFSTTFVLLLFLIACKEGSNTIKSPASKLITIDTFKNGNPKKAVYYPDSTKQESYTEIEYYENGIVAKEKQREGKEYNGIYKVYWNKPGKVLYYSGLSSKGAKVEYEAFYDSLGKIRRYDSLLKPCKAEPGACDAVVTLYYPSGHIKEKFTQINKERNGREELYYENGRLERSGFFIGGLENGLFTFYDDSGRYRQFVTALNGKRQGKAEIIYPDGVLSYGHYVDDKEEGVWYFKDTASGKVFDSTFYRKGVEVSW